MSFLVLRSYDTTVGSFSTEVSSFKMTLSYVSLTQLASIAGMANFVPQSFLHNPFGRLSNIAPGD